MIVLSLMLQWKSRPPITSLPAPEEQHHWPRADSESLVIRISYGYGIAFSIHKFCDFFHVGPQASPKLSVFLQSSLIGGRLLWSLLALILLKIANSRSRTSRALSTFIADILVSYKVGTPSRVGLLGNGANSGSAGSPTALPFPFSFPLSQNPDYREKW
jgi:hypothetical protein